MVHLALNGYGAIARSSQPLAGDEGTIFADDTDALIVAFDLTDVVLMGFSSDCGNLGRDLSRRGAGTVPDGFWWARSRRCFLG